MRVTLVEFSPAGGLFHFAVQLADGLAELGHDVQLVTGSGPEFLPRSGKVEVVPILATWSPARSAEPLVVRKARRVVRGIRYLESWRRLLRHLATDPPDVVQWAEWRFPVDGWLVAALARRLRSSVQSDVAHSPRPFQEQRAQGDLYKSGRLTLSSLRSAYAAMDVVFVLGEGARRDLLEMWPEVRRVELMRHGDERAVLGGGSVSTSASAGTTVLFFGSLSRYKGLHVLLQAWPQVRRSRPDARLVIAGAPGDLDLKELRRAAAEAGGVDLRIGYVPVDEVAGLFGAARLVVAPYVLAYGSGVVALAHTCSRPVVASAVGDLITVVADGETGMLVPSEDPEALAAAVLRLLVDPEEADRLGAAGATRIAAAASWTQVAEAVAAVYEDLFASRQDARPQDPA